MAQFSLKVTNAVTLGSFQNIDWLDNYTHQWAGSSPDSMPIGSTPVSFTVVNLTGKLVTKYLSGGAWKQGQSSSVLTLVDGATYVWDMAANTVIQEGAGAVVPGGSGQGTPGGETMTPIVTWVKAHPWQAAAIGLGALYLFGGKKRLL